MKEELIEKLCAFNLSLNQAKVYAYLCEVTNATVTDISQATQIHTQDIYKVVAVLEKKGLATKTKITPIIIEAAPVKEALNNSISSIEAEAIVKIKNLKKYCKEITAAIEDKKATKCFDNRKSGRNIIVLTKQAPQTKIDLAFENLREEYDCVILEGESLKYTSDPEHQKLLFKKIAERGASIKIVSLSNGKRFTYAEVMKQNMPKKMAKANYEIKTLQVKDSLPYTFALIDFRELWLPIPSTGKEGALIVTDTKEVIELAKRQFEALWNDPNTVTIAKSSTKEKVIA